MMFAWDRRIRRAEELRERFAFAQEVLRFYVHVVRFQEALQDKLRVVVHPPPAKAKLFPLRQASPLEHREVLGARFSELLELVCGVGPQELATVAKALQQTPQDRWEALWETYWQGGSLSQWGAELGAAIGFFPKAFLQPYGALLAAGLRGDGEDRILPGGDAETSGRCPLCGGPPQVSVLREEGHGAARSMLCSRCETEWRYQRARCVACGEETSDRLVYLHATDWPHVRVAACRSCGRYIKEVDLTRDGLAVPVVDELATLPLDLVATEEGYRKVEPNLIGL